MFVETGGSAWDSGVAMGDWWCTYVVLRSNRVSMWLYRIGSSDQMGGASYSREISQREYAQQTGLATSSVADDDQLPVQHAEERRQWGKFGTTRRGVWP